LRILFTVGLGILPEQRLNRWKMVSDLYGKLARSFLILGHEVYFVVHPEALTESIPYKLALISSDHSELPLTINKFKPDFLFVWNGSSPGDEATATIANALNVKVVFSEQGWFPQSESIYFDFSGCNGRCSTINTKFPVLTKQEELEFHQARQIYLSKFATDFESDRNSFCIQDPDLTKHIFVPLQDERDLNIIQDSPFKSMDDFLLYLTTTFPKVKFLVRPHPKYPAPHLSKYKNVKLSDPKKSLHYQLSKCGLVIGINSTVLLESALIGLPVVAYGQGLATGTGLFYDARADQNINLSRISWRDIRQTNMSFLYHLLCKKQIRRADLSNPTIIMKSDFFRSLHKRLVWAGR
jgi:hypothetical protein